jgi:hypothetical protein
MACRLRAMTPRLTLGFLLALSAPALAQTRPWRQTQADDYTRYVLLDPATQSFRIYYYVTATTPGAPYYFNTIRKGAEETVHGVYDAATGAGLEWDVVEGRAARALGMTNADTTERYIRVRLARPVPENGESRVLIDKTYRDPASVMVRESRLVFDRPLGIKRNAVVLPAGYELVGVNYPSQVMQETDGRIKVSYMNPGPQTVPYVVTARPGQVPAPAAGPPASAAPVPMTVESIPAGARVRFRFTERAFQDREIVYLLDQPETHAFRLYHDYTEIRPGTDRYVNVVRPGSRSSSPSARNLDTGQPLKVETLRGNEIAARGVDIGEPVTPQSEAVVIWFDSLKAGQSLRLRIEETYTDPNRYLLQNDELIWDRAFGRPRNAVILPAGWYLTTSSIPAVVSETDDGRVRLDFTNDRPDEIQVFIKARRRPGS